jgi:hypothetical protein
MGYALLMLLIALIRVSLRQFISVKADKVLMPPRALY